MFTGIEEVDWPSLGHAFGPADDVPGMLRALASADQAERELALDALYGTVHHQGDVYDSTLACIPFLLELVADPAVQDRGGLVELLTSIGSIDLAGDDETEQLDPEDEEFEDAANYAMAAAAVAAGADVFLGLLRDDDPEVRLTAPGALASLHGEPERVLELLRERLTVETDTEVRLALVDAVGRIALRYGSLREETVDWLRWLMGAAQSPVLRLAVLAQLARCAPERLPRDIVATTTGLLRAVRAEPALPLPLPPPPAEGPAESAPEAAPEVPGDGVRPAPTLVGQLRELREEHPPGPGTPWTDDLLRTLHTALDDRVDDRIELVTAQLHNPDPAQRTDAIWMCGSLIRTWRGRYDEVVRLVGTQLMEPDPRPREAATGWLEGLFVLARPAADALAARVALDPEPWARGHEGSRAALGSALLALARCGDPRAVPALAAALEEGELRDQLAHAVSFLGGHAAPLAPGLRRRLGRVALDDELYDRAAPLLRALAGLGHAEALPEVLRVLRGAPAFRRHWVVEAALRTLAAFGPAAREAVPDLRALLGEDTAALSTGAARALWRIEGDTDAVLPVLGRWLGSRAPGDRRAAARALGSMGPGAAGAAGALRGCLTAPDVWVRTDAAAALWRVSGDERDALPALLAAWEENRYVRVEAARCLVLMGPWATGAAAALRAELARRRRHNVVDGGSGSHDIDEDERLLALCREALAGLGEEPGVL
ncbi:HEAT repeat domain-containing protein [Streptomyces sp. NPDC001941]|uniref:HEAT repeat domain-containing protein n=1 Tax=Streptomyces sp. NPDC001941 TaxID=3154659 RepID=UPI003322D365